MRRYSQYFAGCFGAAFVIASFLVALEVSATTAAPSITQDTVSINRVLKGDRMPLVTPVSGKPLNRPLETKAPPTPSPKPRLLEGCEPVISAIGQSPLAQVAGRCIS
ncbi:MAG TPA: hypothetical protein VH934_11355 [Xanthobacteraceae bacterium]|jgi:hypothetical protein